MIHRSTRRTPAVLSGTFLLLLLAAVLAWQMRATDSRTVRNAGLPPPAARAGAWHGHPAHAPRARDARATGVAPVAEALPGARWGGAANSAQESGAGFFDRTAARSFTAAVPAGVAKYVVDLNARAFLPLPGEDNLSEALPATTAKPAPGHTAAARPQRPGEHVAYLQFKEHPRDDQRRVLAAQGIELLGYLSGYAWAARGTPGAFQAALRLDFVRAAARVDARDKVHALVFRGETPEYARAPDGRTRFMLLAYPGTASTALAGELADDTALAQLEAQPAPASVLGPRFEIVAPAAAGVRLAALNAAAFVSFVPPPAAPRGVTVPVAARDATTDVESNIGSVRDGPPNLSGNSVKVAVREVGKMDAHADFAARLVYVDSDGDPTTSTVNHATAVTGVIGSNGVAQAPAKGVAPAVSMFAYSLTDDTFQTNDVLDAAARGARVSNHSYGPASLTSWGDYESLSADWDAAIRANDLTTIFAGNEESGGLYKHIDYLVGAKNTICVSATNSAARAGNDNPPIPKADGIATFSEFGPMNDGRVKPDLVAFGDTVTLDKGLSDIQSNSGTSFSAPTVTGVAALISEYYKTVAGHDPSAALLKALLCNSATDLGAPGPDATYGFGILNAKEAAVTISKRDSTQTPFLEDVMANGGTKTYTVNLQSATELKVVLCWMDFPGSPGAAKALVNDLDLEVEAPDGTKHLPFSLDPDNPSAPATNTGRNTVDPIEQVVVSAPADGAWIIRVLGTSVAQGTQTFALCLNQPAVPPPLSAVITASPDAGPAPLTVSFSAALSTGTPTTYSWDFGDGMKAEDAGLVTVDHTYTAAGSFTVSLTLDGTAGATHVVLVTKRHVDASARKARAALSFRGDPSSWDDDFQFTLNSSDLAMSPSQARDAVRSGDFLGQTYAIRIGGTADGTVPATKVAEVMLNNRAMFTSREVMFRRNLTKGDIQVTLRNLALEDIFSADGMSRDPAGAGVHDMPVEIETPDAVYRAVFHLLYKVGRMSGTAKGW